MSSECFFGDDETAAAGIAEEANLMLEKDVKTMSQEEARVERERLETTQALKVESIWKADMWIMILEGRLRMFGTLNAEELKKLDENRNHKAFIKRGHAWGERRLVELRKIEAAAV